MLFGKQVNSRTGKVLTNGVVEPVSVIILPGYDERHSPARLWSQFDAVLAFFSRIASS